jgi:hypothetical protein
MTATFNGKDTKITIKNFGDNRTVDTVEDLKKTFDEEYRDVSISITYIKKDTGMKIIIHVTVDSSGQASRSYGTKEPLDYEAIKNAIYQ